MKQQINFLDLVKEDLIDNYRPFDGLNYSLMKEIASGNVEAIRDGIPNKRSIYLDFGSYIDKTIDNGKEPEIYTYKVKELTGHSKVLVDKLIDNREINASKERRLEIADELELWKGVKVKNKRLEKVSSDNIEDVLIKERVVNSGGDVIYAGDLSLAKHLLNVLYTHEYSKNIISPSIEIEQIKQFAVSFKFNGVVCKVLLDFLNIDHNNKTIHPIDLKTGSKKDFNVNYFNYKYWLQGGLYNLAIIYLKSKYKELEDYTIKPFTFLYISRDRAIPLNWEMQPADLEKSVEGFTNIYGNKVKGIVDFIEDYKFHKKTGIYDVSRDEYESDGLLKLPSLS